MVSVLNEMDLALTILDLVLTEMDLALTTLDLVLAEMGPGPDYTGSCPD